MPKKGSSTKTPENMQENPLVEDEKASVKPKKSKNEIDEIFSGKKRKRHDEKKKKSLDKDKTMEPKSVKRKKEKKSKGAMEGDAPGRPRRRIQDGLSIYTEEELETLTPRTLQLWVDADGKPHYSNSHTLPRTEIRIKGLDYSSGVWQFEGYGFVPNGTSGVSVTVSQIHGGAAHDSSTIILRIYDGNMRGYSGDLTATGMYEKWFRLNLIHDADEGTVNVFLDGVPKYKTKDRGPGHLYFKCGVYAAPRSISYYMESRWRDIKIYKK